MGFALKKFPELFRKKGAIIFVPLLVLVLVFASFLYIIIKQNSNTVARFNEQVRGIAKSSTIYIANNYDLYGSPLTIKFQNIVKDYLTSNDEVARFKVFNTNGKVVFDSANPSKTPTESVSDETLNASRNDEIISMMDKKRISLLVSPYFEEWGAHKYSILFYPSYVQVDAQNRQFDLQAGVITALLVLSVVSMVLLFMLAERYKAHKEEAIRLATLDKQRQEFMMLVAHNLRTPVTIMEGYLSLLSDKNIPAGLKESISPIYDASSDLNKLVGKILAITEVLGQPDIKISKQNLKLPELIAEIIKDYQSKIDQKKLSVNLNFEPQDVEIFANNKYAKMIFTDIIDNAIKFNKEGGEIHIGCKLTGQDALLTFMDTGIGITKDKQQEIFAQFHKSDGTDDKYTYNHEGSGIGLYTAKVLVETFGGKIWFESEEDKGTTFYISLPSNN